ncbi:hypothetical protein EJ08DRAFT_663842 [Tothia fuscella]|uniref:Uncharacterized protein n=1 Tax=Tothia fuscella TaxID=1048955 RepID=A0A9P4TV12_9PEZI|nr:hypothetical protein EJ08DRAFT_663842 [Tothia fuscella]
MLSKNQTPSHVKFGKQVELPYVKFGTIPSTHRYHDSSKPLKATRPVIGGVWSFNQPEQVNLFHSDPLRMFQAQRQQFATPRTARSVLSSLRPQTTQYSQAQSHRLSQLHPKFSLRREVVRSSPRSIAISLSATLPVKSQRSTLNPRYTYSPPNSTEKDTRRRPLLIITIIAFIFEEYTSRQLLLSTKDKLKEEENIVLRGDIRNHVSSLVFYPLFTLASVGIISAMWKVRNNPTLKAQQDFRWYVRACYCCFTGASVYQILVHRRWIRDGWVREKDRERYQRERDREIRRQDKLKVFKLG